MHCRTCGKDVLEQAVFCVGCGCPPLVGKNYCQQCGAETNSAAIACTKCGVALKTGGGVLPVALHSATGGESISPSDPPKDPILMAILSGCTIPWLGQILLGQKKKGIVMMIVTVVAACLIVGIFLWPVAALDAYFIGKKLKEGKTVREWEFF
jgi:hypothetical protein